MRQNSGGSGQTRQGPPQRSPGRREANRQESHLAERVETFWRECFFRSDLEDVVAHASVGQGHRLSLVADKQLLSRMRLPAARLVASLPRYRHTPHGDMTKQMRQLIKVFSQPAWAYCFSHSRRRPERPRPYRRFSRTLSLPRRQEAYATLRRGILRGDCARRGYGSPSRFTLRADLTCDSSSGMTS